MGACTRPINGWRGPNGTVTFLKHKGWIDRPMTIRCGQCADCRVERKRDWGVRAFHESLESDHNAYLTLTYKNMPEAGSLNSRDWQLFAKRQRKELGPFRFIQCGEYGDEGRPHHHACIFGEDYGNDRIFHKMHRGNPLYTSETLSRLWGHGFAYIGQVTFQSASYVAGYVCKKITGQDAEEYYAREHPITGAAAGRKPEFITMSKHPGLGNAWYNKWKEDIYPRDQIVINGKRVRPPRYYDKLREREQPEQMQMVKGRRALKAAAKWKDNSERRREAKDIVTRAGLTQHREDF